MTDKNVNTLWGRAIIDELAKAGVEAVVTAPGSRSTPLTLAAHETTTVEVYSLLDERSSAFFVLGRAKRTGRPTPLICTSGTAAAEFHPAVLEAEGSRTPMLLLTADRPPALQDSGANQTVDQRRLYGDAVRFYRTLPEPEADGRKFRSLRTTVDRAFAKSLGPEPGPVHLNVPFAKPLEPSLSTGSVPEGFAERNPSAVHGRQGPYVTVHSDGAWPDQAAINAVRDAVETAERGLIVAGPASRRGLDAADAVTLSELTGFPVLADPLSGIRFGPHVSDLPICGGYDAYLATEASDPMVPEVVLRFGAAPTSQVLKEFLADSSARQFLVDPAGGWQEATFTATDLIEATPTSFTAAVEGALSDMEPSVDETWRSRFATAEAIHRDLVNGFDKRFEGGIAASIVRQAPDPSTLYVSSSMPVRDLDRFGTPNTAEITILGSRGASGIDGITSAAAGAGSVTAEPMILLIGDLAFYHDLTGLLALERAGVKMTIVLINNDGGGIFHKLPISELEPPFTELFKTPHGLEFSHAADLFGLEYDRVDGSDDFESAYRDALQTSGSRILDVTTDASDSFEVRDRLQRELLEQLI